MNLQNITTFGCEATAQSKKWRVIFGKAGTDVVALALLQIFCFLILAYVEPRFVLIHFFQLVPYVALFLLIAYGQRRWAYMIGPLVSIGWLALAYWAGLLHWAVEQLRATEDFRSTATLLREIQAATGVTLSESILTLGFARRATEYKRANFIFSDVNRLRAIRQKAGPFQILFAGKAHPQDELGKTMIRGVFKAGSALRDTIPVVYVHYDLRWARLFTSGVDLWLNTPHRPLEASGTSGMKAALNGVPSFSVRDGWWVEGHFEGVTGWSIGYDEDPEEHAVELESLYAKLEETILPMFYENPLAYPQVMRSAIAVNGSFFNTQRMISQYLLNAYAGEPTQGPAGATETAGHQLLEHAS